MIVFVTVAIHSFTHVHRTVYDEVCCSVYRPHASFYQTHALYFACGLHTEAIILAQDGCDHVNNHGITIVLAIHYSLFQDTSA